MDKLTPGMRADVLELLMAYRDLSDGRIISRVSEFREEAVAQGGRGHIPLIMCPGNTRACGGFGCLSAGCAYGLKSGEAARREAEHPCDNPGACEVGGCLKPSLCQAAAVEDKLAPAADDLVKALDRWDRSICGELTNTISTPSLLRQAIDRIEAQARLVEHLSNAASRFADLADIIAEDKSYDAVGFMRASAKRYAAALAEAGHAK